MMSRNAVAVAWALHARGLTPTAWKVLMVLAHRVNNKRGDWDVWPKQQTLANDCELTLSTLKRHLDELEAKGKIVREKRYKSSGGFAGCTYRLAVKACFDTGDGNVNYDFASEEEDCADDATLGQIDLARSPTVEPARSLNGELAIEPLNIEPLNIEKRESPLPPEGEDEEHAIALVDPWLSDDDLAELYQTAWAKLVTLAPKLPAMRPLTADAKKTLVLRIDDHAMNRSRESVNDVLRKVFVTISTSRLLRGEKDNRDGSAWRPNAAWVLKKANFNKIMGDAYAADHVIGPDGFASGDGSIGAAVAGAVRAMRASGAFAPKTARELAGGSRPRSPRFE